ncbi:MAG TPA: hypothetical protein VHT75_03260 [Acidimicrobiales bacterium]|nr:hypothetical protein [Acidimicrobiales bacterium]
MSSRPGPVSPAGETEADTGSWSDPLPFPIEDYDELRVVEIISVLPELDDEELEEVRRYEQEQRGRAAIISRIDSLLERTAAPARGTDEGEAPPARTAAPAMASASGAGAAGAGEAGGSPGAEDLPIAEYDFLGVSEILPLLAELDPEELEDVRAYEADARGRATILFRIDALLGAAGRPEPAHAPEPQAELEPEPEAEPQAPVEPEPAAAREFPIADYDRLRVFQIIPLLRELDVDELDEVRGYEEAHRKRVTVLNQINKQLSAAAPPPPPAAAPAAPSAAEALAVPEPELPAAELAPEPEPEPVGAAEVGAGDLAIADYDNLGLRQVLPLLNELYDDELEQIRDYEDAHRARVAILRHIDALLQTPIEEPAAGPEATPPGGPPAAPGGPPEAVAPPVVKEPAPPVVEEAAALEFEEPEEPEAAAAAAVEPGEVGAALPIAEYDSLSAFAVLPMLDQLSPDELEQIREYEDANRARVTILYRIDKLLFEPEPEPQPVPEPVPQFESTAPEASAPTAEEEPAVDEQFTAGAAAMGAAGQVPPVRGEREIDIADMPIADYDQLMVSEILPLLAELYDDELELVREFEDANLARVAILARIDALLQEPYEDEVQDEPEPEPVGADAGEVEPEATAPVAGEAAAEASPAPEEEEAFEEDEEFEDEEPPAAAGDDSFPIADYDELRVAEILPLLSQLRSDELEQVARHEQEGGNRVAILNRIERLLRLSAGD